MNSTNYPKSKPASDRLEMLYQLSQAFNSSLDLDQVLNRVMDEVIIATHAERGFVMLKAPDGKMAFRVARGIDQKTIYDPRFQVSLSIVDQVSEQGQPILTSDAQTDARFSMRQSVMILGLRSILCVPLIRKDEVIGVIYVDNRIQAGIFSQSDLELLTAIASNAAIAIENARLYQVAVEKGRLEKELQMALQVQASLLPTETPKVPGWEFAARWQPAQQVAGDYYDFIQEKDGDLSVVIADVSGKGMTAALFMALSRSLVRASLDLARTPARGIYHANQLICRDATQSMFITVFYAWLSAQNNQVTYVNAGHNPPLLCHSGARHMKELTLTGRALGLLTSSTYTQQTVELEVGDYIVLYTDGVTDALDANEKPFGMQRLRQVVQGMCKAPAQEILNAVVQAVSDYTGTADPYDDITLVVIKRV